MSGLDTSGGQGVGSMTSKVPLTCVATWANDLVTAACRAAGPRVVLVPALYCPSVARSIERAGAVVRYYDVHPGLEEPVKQLDQVVSDDVGALVWHHPFGIYHRPPSGLGIPIIEDACVALRTFSRRGILIDRRDLAVFSLRKEFGWHFGGVATGDRVSPLYSANVDGGGCGIGREPSPALMDWLPLTGEGEPAPVRAAGGGHVMAWEESLPPTWEADIPIPAPFWRRFLAVFEGGIDERFGGFPVDVPLTDGTPRSDGPVLRRRLDVELESENGAERTERARALLGRRLPGGDGDPDVLTWLPLLSSDRDEVVARLRSCGVDAWFWGSDLPGIERQELPVVGELHRKLFLVPPLPEEDYELLLQCDLENWPSRE